MSGVKRPHEEGGEREGGGLPNKRMKTEGKDEESRFLSFFLFFLLVF